MSVPERERSPRRGMCAAVLSLEAITLGLTTPVLITIADVDVPVALAWCATIGLKAPLDTLTYFLGRETVIASPKEGMAIWREQLFSVMATNAQPATAFFRIPTGQVIEIGAQIEI